MNSGTYIIEGGGFSVSGNASVSGSGVMIFNAGSNYPNAGRHLRRHHAQRQRLVQPDPADDAGLMPGIVIFQTRDNSKALTVSGNASGMTGTIYAPAAQLDRERQRPAQRSP